MLAKTSAAWFTSKIRLLLPVSFPNVLPAAAAAYVAAKMTCIEGRKDENASFDNASATSSFSSWSAEGDVTFPGVSVIALLA